VTWPDCVRTKRRENSKERRRVELIVARKTTGRATAKPEAGKPRRGQGAGRGEDRGQSRAPPESERTKSHISVGQKKGAPGQRRKAGRGVSGETQGTPPARNVTKRERAVTGVSRTNTEGNLVGKAIMRNRCS